MLLAAVVVAGGAFAYKHFTYEPRYESKATLYLLRQMDGEEAQSSSNAYNNYNLSLKLVNDCDYLIKSHSVLDKVIATLRLQMTYDELYCSITVSNPEETRILEVVVEADTPQEAKKIVDEVCDVATVAISDAMGFEQVNLYEYGVLESEPSNTTSLSLYAVLGLLAAVAVYVFLLVRFLLDDRLRSDEDIQRHLGLSLLGDIPNPVELLSGKYYKSKYYKSKYYK